MQRPKHDYGSEYRLWCYWRNDRAKLDGAILSAIGAVANTAGLALSEPT